MVFDHRIWVRCVSHPEVLPGEIAVCTNGVLGMFLLIQYFEIRAALGVTVAVY